MAKLKFKDENGNFIPVVQDVKVNGVSVFDGKDASVEVPLVLSGTTDYWNSLVGYIPPANSVIIYTDYYSEVIDEQEVNYPNIKIGSGNGFVQDLVFIGQHESEELISHINNSNIHVTTTDKQRWNNKLNIDDTNEVVNETLIFNRN